jgi:hypothetical protein
MSAQEFMFRAVCLALAALIALNTWFMWRRGEALRRDLDEARRRVEEARKERK